MHGARALGELERARRPERAVVVRSSNRSQTGAGEDLGRVGERPGRKTIVRSPSRQVKSRSAMAQSPPPDSNRRPLALQGQCSAS